MNVQLTKNRTIERAIGVLANTMRLYVEAHFRFDQLFNIDREEAIDNLDRAFEAKLEAFHTLYDLSKGLVPYFDYGDTTLIIAVRNAIHHRDHPLFQSLYSRMFLIESTSKWAGASFLLATYPTLHGAPIRMTHYVRLDDIEARLDPKRGSPHLDKFMKADRAEQRFELIERQLEFSTIRKKGASERYPENQIYLDLMPVFTSAVCRVFKALKAAGIAFKGFDASTYVEPFTSEIEVNFRTPVFTVSRFNG